MFIFANPLGTPELDRTVTLIHPAHDLPLSYKDLKLVYRLFRSLDKEQHLFYCYRRTRDIPRDHKLKDLTNPFLTPSREVRTQPRGKFKLPIEPM